MSSLLLFLATAALLAGCAAYTWTKPGVTPEVAARDDTECRAQARDLAAEFVLAPGPLWGPPWRPVFGPDPFWWGAPGWDPGWSLQIQQRVYDRCMASKGYRLVKAPKGEPPAAQTPPAAPGPRPAQ